MSHVWTSPDGSEAATGQIHRLAGLADTFAGRIAAAVQLPLLHAADLTALGGLGPDGLTPPTAGNDPTNTGRWWVALTPAEQATVLALDDRTTGNLTGIPPAPRSQANEIALQQDLHSPDPDIRNNAQAVLSALAGARSLIDPVTLKPVAAQVGIADLNATKANVTKVSQAVAKTIARHGSVPDLKGQWATCNDITYGYLQYLVKGRLDVPAGTARPLTPAVVSELRADGWTGSFDRGPSSQSSVGLDKGDVGLELDEDTADQIYLFHLTGPCQRATKAVADQLLPRQAATIRHA